MDFNERLELSSSTINIEGISLFLWNLNNEITSLFSEKLVLSECLVLLPHYLRILIEDNEFHPFGNSN